MWTAGGRFCNSACKDSSVKASSAGSIYFHDSRRRSEAKLQTKLNDAHGRDQARDGPRALRSYLRRIRTDRRRGRILRGIESRSGGERRARRIEVGMIRQVETFSTELHFGEFLDPEVFGQTEIEVVEPRTAQDPVAGI